MKLTDEQKDETLKKLRPVLSNPCGCGGRDWLINEKIFELREYNGKNLLVGGGTTIFPVIAASCKNCGNTLFFNALILRVIEKDDAGKQT